MNSLIIMKFSQLQILLNLEVPQSQTIKHIESQRRLINNLSVNKISNLSVNKEDKMIKIFKMPFNKQVTMAIKIYRNLPKEAKKAVKMELEVLVEAIKI